MKESFTGVMKTVSRGAGVLRLPDNTFKRTSEDVFVPFDMVRKYRLSEGATITGEVGTSERGRLLKNIDSVCGMDPNEFKDRPDFRRLTAIDPQERFDFTNSQQQAMRILDIVAPIGKGTRGLIVSPPKAGKTTLLKQLALSIREAAPETRIIVLLVDERPEEVTDFQRSTQAEVLASSSDESVQLHTMLSEMTLAQLRTELECGHDVVVLVDSLTRMGRAFNLRGSGTGKMLSGGIEAGSLDIPRRFFGSARNIENGGSITILATALVETGSRMDELIFEEFKGTGNSELVLDRELAESRLFPAIRFNASGTRKEENLFPKEQLQAIQLLRRVLAKQTPAESIKFLIKLTEQFPDNIKALAHLSQLATEQEVSKLLSS